MKILRGGWPTVLWALILAPGVVHAQGDYPFIKGVDRLAIQVGQTVEVGVLVNQNSDSINGVVAAGEGITAQLVPPVPGPDGKPARPAGLVKATFTVAANVMPGEREFRLLGPMGASGIGTLWVTRDPVVTDVAENNTQATAQPISLPVTICGSFKAEQADYFKFTMAQPGEVTFNVVSARVEEKCIDLTVHSDPVIILHNSLGSVLALGDNYFGPDPILRYHFSQAGEYVLEVRDVRYQADPGWQYAVEINDRPFVTMTYPLRVLPGTSNRLELLGLGVPAATFWSFDLAADAADGVRRVVPSIGGQPVNPVPVFVSRMPDVFEQPGDNDTATSPQLTTIPLPAGISGRLEGEGDVDCYRFEARKDEPFTFEVVARRVGSSLDSVLRVLDEKGNATAMLDLLGGARIEIDDGAVGRFASADAMLQWTAPVDGRYLVEVCDRHMRGGAEFVYYLKAQRAQPQIYLELDTDKTWLAPGISAPILVRAYRKGGFKGEIQLHADGLPPGVTASCGRILPEQKDGSVILTAAAGAVVGSHANIRVTGTGAHSAADGKSVEVTAVAQPMTELCGPGGPRYHCPVAVHTVAINPPGSISNFRLSTYKVALKPGQSQKIEITFERKADFNKNIELSVIFEHLTNIFGGGLPPGVSVDAKGSELLAVGTTCRGSITLVAAADAKPVENQVAVMAMFSAAFPIKTALSTEALGVSVVAP